MLANDLRVLVSELNGTIQRAAANGLKVSVQAREVLDIASAATRYPEITIRILAEIQ